jgi:mannose-1-phosphate guanylyltransferase/phosphomannomutase
MRGCFYVKAVVLAGGFSTRLRPITNHIPKPLVPVVNKPIIDHVVDRLKEANVHDIIFTLYYRAQEIMDHFGDGSKHGVRPQYVVEGKPLGTAGSVKNVEHLLDDVFLVVSGDVLFDFNLKTVIEHHVGNGNMATIVLNRVEDVQQFGVAELNEDGRIVGFVEKPSPSRVTSRLVNTGIYVLNKEVLRLFEKGLKVDFSLDVFPKLVAGGKLYGYVPQGFWYDVGTFQGLLKAQREVLSGRTHIKIPGKSLADGIHVVGDAEIEDPDRLGGPAVIGQQSSVRRGVILRYASLGMNVRMHEGSSAVESVIMDGCEVGRESVLAGVVLGRGCHVEPRKSILGPVGFGDHAKI